MSFPPLASRCDWSPTVQLGAKVITVQLSLTLHGTSGDGTWLASTQCGEIFYHRLGNIGLIALLREELQRDSAHFPVLLNKVLYNGIHCGDYLAVDQIPMLQRELEALADFKCGSREAGAFMSEFHKKISELVAASLAVKKPMVF